ncbi:MAG: WcaI family glycosyltransferase [Arachidicoccus sp.]|nr:WcaI family glycosyltransferase [Arachidicoccus sp.]
MRILIYGINYAPELTGIGKYTGEMAEWLAKKGHEVHVITAMPYYPEWKVHEKYKGKKWFTEVLNDVHVHRCPMYVPAEVNSKKRIIHEFSFVLSTSVYWMKFLFGKKFDIVFCIAPPFHLGYNPVFYKFFRRSRLIYHIQDLQVDAAKDLGMINNRAFLNLMFGMEKWLMKKSTKVSSISNGMIKKIKAKGIPDSKIIFFPNWVDDAVVYPLSKEDSLRRELNIDMETKVILYSGNLGEKQGLEIIIEAAKEYLNNKDILFLICGSGGGKEKLMQLANDAGLQNIRFLPLQPYEKLSALLAVADIHLVLQKKSAADLVMPSKLTGILAAGGYALVAAEKGTSLYEVIDTYQAGAIIEPESVYSLKEGIAQAVGNPQNFLQVKKNAREYAEKFLAKEHILHNFGQELERIV